MLLSSYQFKKMNNDTEKASRKHSEALLSVDTDIQFISFRRGEGGVSLGRERAQNKNLTSGSFAAKYFM